MFFFFTCAADRSGSQYLEPVYMEVVEVTRLGGFISNMFTQPIM